LTQEGRAATQADEPLGVGRALTFEELYQQYFDFTWRVLRNLAVRSLALEDVAQEVWTVVHRRLPEFEQRSSVRTWLFGIARNVARNQRRSERRHQEIELLPDTIPSDDADPEALRCSRETWSSLIRFLDALEEQDRAIFVCNLIEDLSAQETAAAVGVQVMIVYQRVRTLRRLAKDWLELHEEGSSS
jgi:RNA polymerase sigma-70 factor (ECF subfamily)